MTAISEPCLPTNSELPAESILVPADTPDRQSSAAAIPEARLSASEVADVAATQQLSSLPHATVPESSAISMPQIVTAPQPSSDNRAYRWNRINYSKRRRKFDIWSFFITFLNGSWIDGQKWSYVGGYTEAKQAVRRRRQAIWIRDTFLELGPTFIKLGQLFSTRADLFPVEYVEELSKLQDRVPAFGYDRVAEIIERDLGKPIASIIC